jgi:hypothetical protein
MSSPLRWRIFQTPEPTVPNPAKPMPRDAQEFTPRTVAAFFLLSKSEALKKISGSV